MNIERMRRRDSKSPTYPMFIRTSKSRRDNHGTVEGFAEKPANLFLQIRDEFSLFIFPRV